MSTSGFNLGNNSVEEKIAHGNEVAQSWLNLIDSSRYTDSWLETAQYFQNNVTQEEWEKSLLGVRKPLGKILSRQLKSVEYKTSLPGVPDGEYVVIQYNTSFENKQSAIETVTPMLDEDGRWKVAGYFIS
ncbi:MAG: DUF4019 domain-containing protein [Xenococcaceae cyanobacterium MO_188.B29]|nr:DUF4019 domain-containing protein [Xenococcaceae cyanobacterium MO_188.B29]